MPERYDPSQSQSTPVDPALESDLDGLRGQKLSSTMIRDLDPWKLAEVVAAYIVCHDPANSERYRQLAVSIHTALLRDDISGKCLATRRGGGYEDGAMTGSSFGEVVLKQLLKDNQGTAGVRIRLQRFIAKHLAR